MTAPHKQLVLDFYAARRANDESAIRRFLAPGVIWHEPQVNEHTGDLYGPDAVLAMIRAAHARTAGTFSLTVQDVLANQAHAVALISWTAEKAGTTLSGSEFAVFEIKDMQFQQVWFFQQDLRADAAFWHPDQDKEMDCA